jgi:pimeloyl-ACP methyl ester carboxylesterase
MKLAYDDVGEGLPVVLLHAFPLTRQMWRPQVEALKNACRLIVPDLPGFGDSPLPEGTPSVEAMADAVAALLDDCGVREPVVLGGLSMGGYVAFAFVRKYQDRLRKLILADTRAEPDDDTAKANRDKLIETASKNPANVVAEQMLPKLLGARTLRESPAVVDEVKRIAAAQKPEGVVAALKVMRDRPDSRPTLGSIRVPVLFIVGRDDALTPVEATRSMSTQVRDSTVVTIDDSGHLSNLEHPGAFNDAVLAFLV